MSIFLPLIPANAGTQIIGSKGLDAEARSLFSNVALSIWAPAFASESGGLNG